MIYKDGGDYTWRFEEHTSSGFMYGPSQLQRWHRGLRRTDDGATARWQETDLWHPYWWAVCPNPHCGAPSLCMWEELSRYLRCEACFDRWYRPSGEELTYDEVFSEDRTLRALPPEDQKAVTAAFILGGWQAARHAVALRRTVDR